MNRSLVVCGVLLALVLNCQSAGAAAQDGIVPGPESDKLLPAASGYLLIEDAGGIKAIQLPSLKETVVHTGSSDANDTPIIHMMSGPDDQGRIAYIEDHFFVADEKNRRHMLKTIRLDGSHDTTLFTRPGDAMWANSGAGHADIGEHIALSPTKGRVAFVSGTRNVQMPSALLTEGSIEIWDLEKESGAKTEIKVLDDGLAWFPDGKRLAYVKLIDATPKTPAGGEDPFGKSFQKWTKVPAVFIRDIDGGAETFVHIGAQPVISSDGSKVLVGDLYGQWKLVDVATAKATAAAWPGNLLPLAMLERDIVLAWCFPTAGSQIKQTTSNSPLVGPKEMLTLKLEQVNAQQIQTVVPEIDPRTKVSFGRVVQPAK